MFRGSLGLYAELICKNITLKGGEMGGILHCRVRATCESCDGMLDETFGMEYTGAPYGMTEWPTPQGLGDYYKRFPIGHPGTDCDF